MAKCRKVLPTGRCINNALAGRNLCAALARIANRAPGKPVFDFGGKIAGDGQLREPVLD
jgi:hypothetical protein